MLHRQERGRKWLLLDPLKMLPRGVLDSAQPAKRGSLSTIAAQLQKSLQSRLRTGSQPRAQPLCGGTQGDNGRPEGRAGRQSLELEIQEGQLGAGERAPANGCRVWVHR